MVTDGNRETNLVAMVAVKDNSVKRPFLRHKHIIIESHSGFTKPANTTTVLPSSYSSSS